MEVLKRGDATVTLAPEAGGRVAGLRIGDHDLIVGPGTGGDEAVAPEPLQWGCFPMVPWPGRLRDGRLRWRGAEYRFPATMPPHAIHGTTWSQPWDDAGHDGTSAVMSRELGPPWPFGGRVLHRVALGDDHLSLTLEVHAGDVDMPAACGWHPWFRRDIGTGHDLVFHLPAAHMWERGPDHLPTGRLVEPTPGPWDDCFTDLAGPPVLSWPGAVTLTITSSCRHWVVYDEQSHALCVEPQTLPPDGLNHDPEPVPAGGMVSATCTISW